MPLPSPALLQTRPMVLQRRAVWGCAFAAAVVSCWPLFAAAQTSTRVIRIVVPFAAGGGNDVFARQIAQGLTELRGQSVVVDNKPGAGGNLGTELVVRAPPDGNTLLLGHSGTLAINPSLYPKLSFNPQRDLMPVAMFASSPLVLVVNPALPVKSVKDLVALAHSQPGRINYASSGSGTGAHLTGELFELKSKSVIVHIPYKGTAPALTDVIGGQVQMMFSVAPAVLPHIASGRLRALAVTGDKRLPGLPQVPTVAESGLPGFESSLTYGLMAPAGTPETLINELSAQILKAAATPAFLERLANEGAVPLSGGPVPFAARIKAEHAKWADIIRVSGATPD